MICRPSGCGRTCSRERGYGWQRKTTNARRCRLFHPGRRRQGFCWIHSLTLPPLSYPCVLMDANARTGRRGRGESGSESNNVLGAFGRDVINDYGERLLSFAANHDLSLVNTFFRTPKGGILHTFNGRGKKRVDYILTRQRDRKLVRGAPPAVFPPHVRSQRRVRSCQAPRSFLT